MKLGITGASGQLGMLLVQQALARTAASNLVTISRNTAKLETFTQQGVEARAGDFSSPEGLPAAFAGIERLVIVPTSDLSPGTRTKQHSDAISAAVKAGVKHIIYISTVSPRPSSNVLFDSHFRTEQALFASGVDWTILRMSIYAESIVDGAKRAAASGTYAAVPGAPAAYCTREDIAAAAAGLLTSTGHAGITYHATGPVSVTQPQIADAVAKGAGKPIAFAPMTAEDSRKILESMGLPPFLVDGIFGFQSALREGAFDLVTGDVERLSGRPATSALDVAANAAKGTL